MNCVDCERPLRARGVKASDAPGTLRRYPGGRCPNCYKDAPRLGKQKATECKGCHRKLRPTSVTLLEQPGTVSHRGNSLCSSCWRDDKGLTTYRRETRPEGCKECDTPLRPNHSDPAAYAPNARRHGGKGLCYVCYNADRDRTKEARKPRPVAVKVAPAPKPEPVVMDHALLRLMAQRQERIRRQEQVQRVRVAQEAARRRFIQERNAA